MRPHILSSCRRVGRRFRVVHSAALRVAAGAMILALAFVGWSGSPPAVYAESPPADEVAQPAECTWGNIVEGKAATVVRAQPNLELGMLFSTGGSFAEKPVDTSCDDGQELGPFEVDAGGSLMARLTGSPPAPNKWSLHNYGTGLRIVFEPLLGEGNYGPGQEVVSFVYSGR